MRKIDLFGLKPSSLWTPSIYHFSPAAVWLEGYGYRKKISLSAGSSESGTNYQVKLLVGETSGATGEDFDLNNHAQDFGTDVRFTSADGETELDFWRKEITGATPNELAEIWVEVAADLNSAQDIYCYYGKTGASDVSSGVNTFPLFDDFPVDGGPYPPGAPSGWTIDNAGTGNFNVGIGNGLPAPGPLPGVLYSASSDSSHHRIHHTASHGLTSYVEHLDMAVDGVSAGRLHVYWKRADVGTAYRLRSDGTIQYLSTEAGSDNQALSRLAGGAWYNIEIEVLASGNIKTYYTQDPTLPRTKIHDVDVAFVAADGILGLGDYATLGAKFDNVRVRKFAATEPAFSSAGSEESA